MSGNISTHAWVEDHYSYVAMFQPDQPFPLVERVTNEPPLDNMQARVGGIIELGWNGKINNKPFQLICNEDGRRLGLRVNVAATAWLCTHYPAFVFQEPLVGPIMVLAGREALMT